ncbi:60Kd inner membrane protein-domain-containing protein [Flammula alnicola]|nr:60Kd inner membrane protein-domain-containing protein [Flammula alnicola]
MAFASSVGLGMRHGALRLSSSSISNRSNARLFSSLLLKSGSSRIVSSPRAPSGYRNLSLFNRSSAPKTPEATSPTEETAAAGVDASSSIPDVTGIAESDSVADVSSEAVSGFADAVLEHIPAALQYGDLAAMGLAGWSPAGLVRWSLELINVSTGLPWFWTIVAGTAFWRLCCVPLAIVGLRQSARMQPHQAEFLAMRERLTAASATRNPLEIQKASLAMKAFNKKHNINPALGLVSLIQMPITLGMFFGVQKLGTLPLDQLKDSGFSLIPDLTAGDPTYVLPALLCAVVNAQIMIGIRDINTTERPGMGHVMNILRVFSLGGIYLMASFPSALTVSLLTTASLTMLQSIALRIPSVRRALDIPVPPPDTQGKLPTMMETVRYARNYGRESLAAKVQEARRQAVEKQRLQRRR